MEDRQTDSRESGYNTEDTTMFEIITIEALSLDQGLWRTRRHHPRRIVAVLVCFPPSGPAMNHADFSTAAGVDFESDHEQGIPDGLDTWTDVG